MGSVSIRICSVVTEGAAVGIRQSPSFTEVYIYLVVSQIEQISDDAKGNDCTCRVPKKKAIKPYEGEENKCIEK